MSQTSEPVSRDELKKYNWKRLTLRLTGTTPTGFQFKVSFEADDAEGRGDMEVGAEPEEGQPAPSRPRLIDALRALQADWQCDIRLLPDDGTNGHDGIYLLHGPTKWKNPRGDAPRA